MELKTQYNKTALAELKNQLVLRETALPILKNKETALRQEVKNRLQTIRKFKKEYEEFLSRIEVFDTFWQEFPAIVNIEKLDLVSKKIIGVKVPELRDIVFDVAEVSWFSQRAWIPAGIETMKEVVSLRLNIMVSEKQLDLLYRMRKKTTQKVNLYEKVQIPMLEKEILKIKRFLEDEENISKAAQKIVKNRNKSESVVT